MKKNKIFGWLAMTLLLAGGLSFTSCEDQPDKFELTDGTPTINYIRMPYLAQADSLIDAASMESIICLVGNNLTSIREIYFNDQKAQLNTSYITEHTLFVQVPDGIPDEVSDKIFMITKSNETVEYPFHVIVPGPTITSMSYEAAKPGTEVTIYGDYFIDDPNVPLSIIFPGNVAVTEIKEINKTSVRFIIPANATEEGKITIKTIYGTATSKFRYNDTFTESGGMLFDFDGLTGLGNHGWHERVITTDDEALTGNYVQLGDGTTVLDAAAGWNDGLFSFEYWAGSWNSPVDYPERDGIRLFDLVKGFDDPSEFALKFDLCIPADKAWKSGAMQIIFAGVDRVSLNSGVDIYGNTCAGANNTFFHDDNNPLPRALYCPWAATGSFDTGGKWITVTLPIATDFKYDYTGALISGATLKKEDFASLTIFVWEGGRAGTDCTPLIKIDNIRLVSIK